MGVNNKKQSFILKLALFATGLSGIVAEYVLSTMATYFLGNAVIQWTLTVSVMLFSMGLGSRISRVINTDRLRAFVILEFSLSLITAFSGLFVYLTAAYTELTGVLIYFLCITIGLLIGMEIPLVVMINSQYEKLKVNISSVLENDYYGSLVGGVLFAFVGLPFLGLTYTPIVLGSVNFCVALLLMYMLWDNVEVRSRRILTPLAVVSLILMIIGYTKAEEVVLHAEQVRYKDKVVLTQQTKYQKIVITQWQDDYWLYINNNQQLSTYDEKMYHEPLVHPVMTMHPYPQDILVLGGGDGCAVREILKYPTVKSVTLVDLDPAMTDLAQQHDILLKINEGALNDEKVQVFNEDGFQYIENVKNYYDIIMVDLPDPKTVDINRLYTQEFYEMVSRRLRPNGMVITQAGSPYFATKAFLCIDKTLKQAGFNTALLHNQVVTLGEWGWVMGVQEDSVGLKGNLNALSFDETETEWINHEAMSLMTSFGKNITDYPTGDIEVNTVNNPVLYRYYLKGNWDVY